MDIALFSLTGFANTLLPALCRAGFKPRIFVTRAEPGPFPHYPLPNALPVAAALGVKSGTDCADEEHACRSDLLLVATYHRRIPRRIYESCGAAINLHPSLLPNYRGANPFHWVLANGEKETGISAVRLSEEMDAGDLCGQWRLPICANETNGSLRKRLADLAAHAAVETIGKLKTASLIFTPQDEAQATYAPRDVSGPGNARSS
jgi:methionyl-tRNA formyltransferase